MRVEELERFDAPLGMLKEAAKAQGQRHASCGVEAIAYGRRCNTPTSKDVATIHHQLLTIQVATIGRQ